MRIRFAGPGDLDVIIELIRALAEYEREPDAVRLERETLGRHLFGPRPHAEVLLAEDAGGVQGFALFFHNFSTWEGRPGIYLEDLFVRPEARGGGTGGRCWRGWLRWRWSGAAPGWNGPCSTGTSRLSGFTGPSARWRWTNGQPTG